MTTQLQKCSAAQLLREFERDPSWHFREKIDILAALGSLMPNTSEEEAGSFARNIFQTIRAENVKKLPSDLEEVVKTVPTSGVLMLIEELAKQQLSGLPLSDLRTYTCLLENVTHCDATADLLVKILSELWIEWINLGSHCVSGDRTEVEICLARLMDSPLTFWEHEEHEEHEDEMVEVHRHTYDFLVRFLTTEAQPANCQTMWKKSWPLIYAANKWLSKTMRRATKARRRHMWFLYTLEIDQEPLSFAKTLLQFELSAKFDERDFKRLGCRNFQELEDFLLNLSIRIELALQRSPDHTNRETGTSAFLVSALDISRHLILMIPCHKLSSFVYSRFVALVFKCMECKNQHAEDKGGSDFGSINHGRSVIHLTKILIWNTYCDATKRAIMERGLKINIELYENSELPFPAYEPWVYLSKIMGQDTKLAKGIARRLLPPGTAAKIEGWYRRDLEDLVY